MKKVVLTMVLLFLVGCDKNVEMTEPVATAGKVGYYGMLELLGMRASDVKEKDENGKDVFIVYGDNKYEIVMYNDYERVVCYHGKDELVMYENAEVKLNYEGLLGISVEKFRIYNEVRAGIDFMLQDIGLTGMVDFYTPDMVSVTIEGGKVVAAVATVEAFVESEAKAGRIRLIAKYENGEFVDGDYEIVVSK
jgi:hypothetical protein